MSDFAVAPTETTKLAKATEAKKPATAKRAKASKKKTATAKRANAPKKKTAKKVTKFRMNTTAKGG